VATRKAAQFTKQGYTVVAVDNADSTDYVSTVIKYDPATTGDAARTLAAAIPGASRAKVPGLGSTVGQCCHRPQAGQREREHQDRHPEHLFVTSPRRAGAARRLGSTPALRLPSNVAALPATAPRTGLEDPTA
jgi:hypothetical protein